MTDKERRTEELKAKLRASLKYAGGPPLPGYKERAAAIQAELDRMEAASG